MFIEISNKQTQAPLGAECYEQDIALLKERKRFDDETFYKHFAALRRFPSAFTTAKLTR